MLFHTLEFALFFCCILGLYWVLKQKQQNILLLIGSYFFYGFWNYKLLPLIAISTIIDYICGIQIDRTLEKAKKKKWVILSVVSNLAILAFFKYFNFFAGSLNGVLGLIGLNVSLPVLNIILPVGISFYTFQSMSYSIDIYRGTLNPTKNFIDFAVYVSFFPQLVAGPIERAHRLLPQITGSRIFNLDQFYEGGFLIFWGVFKKVYIADNLSMIVDSVFSGANPSVSLWAGLYAFAFQIYCDFSAYSDMARGLAKMLGIELVVNFNLPYFAKNPREFWQRWHISLSQWLRDYLYIPLGGNKGSDAKTHRNLMTTMILGGLWHGANWTFVLWGFMHGIYLSVHRVIEKMLPQRESTNKYVTMLTNSLLIVLFFHLICLTWLVFRAESLPHLVALLPGLLKIPSWSDLLAVLSFIWLLLIVQFMQYLKKDLMVLFKAHGAWRVTAFVVMFYLFIVFGAFEGKEFIYFQF